MKSKCLTTERSKERSTAVQRYRKSKIASEKCESCGWYIDNRLLHDRCGGLDVHHIIPVSVGGSDDNCNLIVLCPNCHSTVHALWIADSGINFWSGPKTKIELIKKLQQIRETPGLYYDSIQLSDDDLFGDLR